MQGNDQLAELRAMAAASAAAVQFKYLDESISTSPKRRRYGGPQDWGGAAAPDPTDQPHSVVEIPEQLVALLIGSRGSIVKSIEVETGTRIVVGKLPQSGARKVCITGTDDARTMAEAAIVAFVNKRKDSVGSKKPIEAAIPVPARFSSFFIGAAGANLKRIKEMYGVSAFLEKQPEKDMDTHSLKLKGPPEALEQAAEQVGLALLDLHRQSGEYNKPLEDRFASRCAESAAGRDRSQRASELMAPLPPRPTAAAAEAWEAAAAAAAAGAGGGAAGAGAGDDTAVPGVRRLAYEEALPWAALYAQDSACVAYYRVFKATCREGVPAH